MIICSCSVISNRDIERALIEILSEPDWPLPTPGVVYRHLSARMICCGCAPLAVSTIYDIVARLEREGRICPHTCATVRSKLVRLDKWRSAHQVQSTENCEADVAEARLVAAE